MGTHNTWGAELVLELVLVLVELLLVELLCGELESVKLIEVGALNEPEAVTPSTL